MKKIILALVGLVLGASAYAQQDVVGNLSGEFAVSSGRLSYTLPIVTPRGIHGLNPRISISYSDSLGAGLLGAGFSLSASSSISRCTPNTSVDGFKSGLERNANARFCIDSEKLLLVSGQQGQPNSEYHNELDQNIRYFARGGSNSTPQYWEMHTPDGFKYKYEKMDSQDTLQSAWYLTEKSDFFDNKIAYYYNAGITPTLDRIEYSTYKIVFNYENKEQPVGQYREGIYFELSKRLSSIVLSRSGAEINRYRFIYESIVQDNNDGAFQPLEKLKRLTQVEKCYGANGQDGCLRPLSFQYHEQPDSDIHLDHPDDRTIVIPRAHYSDSDLIEGNQLYYRPSYTSADMNTDGLADFCYYKVDAGIMCALSNTDGSYSAPTAWTGNLGYAANDEEYPYYSNIQLIDLNADTYPDFCLTDGTGLRCGINNNGTSFTNINYRSTAFNHNNGFSFAYINSDIYPDVCGLTSHNTYQCFAGTASGVSSDVLVNMQGTVHTQLRFAGGTEEHELNMPAPQWIDIDGDADNDLCWLPVSSSVLKCSYRSTNPSNQSVVMSAPQTVHELNYDVYYGTLYTPNSDDLIEEVRKNVRRYTATFRLSDINGDLLPDICYASGHQYQCAINNGNGFETASTWIDVSSLFTNVVNDGDVPSLLTIRLNDMNLDGLADFCIIKGGQQHCAYNQINTFGDLSVRQSITADIDNNESVFNVYENFVRSAFGLKTDYVFGVANLAYGNILNVADINGDGYPEFCYRSIHGILCTSNDNHGSPALLKGITDSFGQTTEITYGSLISDGLYEAATAIPTGYYETPSNARVVDTITVSTGVATGAFSTDDFIKNTQSYKYKGFLQNPSTSVSGFSAITVTQNERGIKTVTHSSLEEGLLGMPVLIEEYIGNIRLKTKRNEYSVIDLGNGRYRQRLDLAEEKQFDLDGSLVSTSTATSANFDNYGYPQQATSVKTMAEDGETLTTVTDTQYFHDTQNWLLARPDLQTVTHQYQGSSTTRTVDYHFTNGLMTGETIQPSASNASSVAYVYDTAGNIITETTSGSGQSRTVTKTFDDMGRVLSLTNSLGQSEQFTYHNTCSGVVSHTDVAGKLTTTQYDFACRQLSVDAPDDNGTNWTYEWAIVADNALINQPIDHPYSYRNPVVYKVTENHANGTWTRTFFDAIGRDIRSESVGFSSENFDRAVVVDNVYDRFGRKTATTLPYYSINGEYITPSWVTVNYDSASRAVSETKIGPDGSPLTSYYQYNKNTVTLSYSDYSKTTQNGVFGKPLSINENGLTINYRYDALGNLIETNQQGTITSVSYDSRGFKSQQTDPAMGTWTYQYNAFGELVSQIDAKNQTTSFTYDELGRLIERFAPEGQTQWTYFSSGSGIGQLSQEQGVSATKQWVYDNLGRAISETLSVDSQQFVTHFAYDQFSRLQKTTNPNGLEIQNGYDSTGSVNQVSIPANQVQGFDAQRLQEEYQAVLLHLLNIHNDIEILRERRLYHLAKYEEYLQKVNYYTGLLGEVNGEIEELMTLVEKHEDLAARYQLAVDDLQAQATQYQNIYGNVFFGYRGVENGSHKFTADWCVDRRSLGSCRRKESHQLTISDDIYSQFTSRPESNSLSQYALGVSVSSDSSYSYRPADIYSSVAKNYEALRDNAEATAQHYRDQITEAGQSQLTPTVLMHIPTGNMITQWVPIGLDIITMIPVTVEETQAVWQTLSLEDAVTHYQTKIDEYQQLVQQELDAFNNLSQEWADITGQFDELGGAEYHFAMTLKSAGLLTGAGYDVGRLIDESVVQQEQWEQSNAPLVVWAATMRSATGLVETELYGNGLYTKRTINKDTNLITSIETAAYSSPAPLRKIDYTFDQRGMIVEKSDISSATNNTTEQYSYDAQGRLRSWNFDQQINDDNPRHNLLSRSYDYDNRGNMTYKTGAGTMHYNQANQLTSRDVEQGISVNYSYDANGNMLQGDGRSYQWNSFNKAESVSNADFTVNFDYDASYKRVVKKSEHETIYYVNPSYEKVIKHQADGSSEVIHRHNIWNGNDVVATFEKHDGMVDGYHMGDDVKYYHRDHLGNGELVTGADMNVIAQRFYTPYGELVEEVLQREQNATTSVLMALDIDSDDYMRELHDNNDVLPEDTSYLFAALFSSPEYNRDFRGFTSHENIKELGLVNMNARLYDPVIGRLVSADSIIPDISQPLAYNRYAYVRNNPMTYRDPSGHSWWALAAFIIAHLGDHQDLQVASTVWLAVSLGGDGGWFAPSGKGVVAAAVSGAKVAATITFLKTGNLKATAQAAAFGALSAGVANSIGGAFDGGIWDGGHWTAKAALHGVTQGAISDLRGDSFAAGFVSGLASSAAGSHTGDLDTGAAVAITMVAGYISAEAAGGDGLEGAISAAFVFLYNDKGKHGEAAQKKVIINNNQEALDHYLDGNGESVELGPKTKNALRNHPLVQRQSEALRAGTAKNLNDNLSVDMRRKMYHVGKTRVDFSTVCQSRSCTTTYVGFSNDGFWDPIAPTGFGDGIGGSWEIYGGIGYRYNTYTWSETYKDNF